MGRAKSKVIDLSSALLQQGKTATGTQPLSVTEKENNHE